MFRHPLVSLFLAFASCGEMGAQGLPHSWVPTTEKPSLSTGPPPCLRASWPIPALIAPGLMDMPASPIQWVRPLGQDGSGLSVRRPGPPLPQKKRNEATVEVWDIALPEQHGGEIVLARLDSLKRQVVQALRRPPPRHGEVELADLMLSDPAQPQILELAKVRSLQLRFHRIPPDRPVPK